MLFSKKKSILKFLKRINISIPIENSNPANANKKKDIEYKFISSFKLPLNIEIIYNVTHIISEKSKIAKKLVLLKIKTVKDNQNKEFQKTNHDSILIKNL